MIECILSVATSFVINGSSLPYDGRNDGRNEEKKSHRTQLLQGRMKSSNAWKTTTAIMESVVSTMSDASSLTGVTER